MIFIRRPLKETVLCHHIHSIAAGGGEELTAAVCAGGLVCGAGMVMIAPPSHRAERSVAPFGLHPFTMPVIAAVIECVDQPTLVAMTAALHDVEII